jgi:signal transduction histidine kinase/Tfp pilus assembly protein PilF
MLTRYNPIKYLLCVFGVIIINTLAYAQPPSIASLLARLKTSKADTNRISIYKSIITVYRNEKPDSAIFYAQHGLTLSNQLNFTKGVGLMQGQLGVIKVGMGKMDEAKNHLKTALSIFKELNYQPGLVSANNSLGICSAKMGAYNESAQYFLTALNINQANNDTHGLVQSYLKLGTLNEQINNLDKALEYYKKALKLNEQLKESGPEASVLNNLGIVYAKKGLMKQALQCFLQSIKKVDPDQTDLLALALGNAGDAYQQLGNKKKAFDYQNESLALARKLQIPEAEATTLVNLASLKTQTKPDSSLLMLKQALAITKALHHQHLRLDVYTGLIDVYKQQGKYKEATQTLETRDALKDSVFTLKNSKDIANLIATNDLANSQIKVQKLQLSNAQNQLHTWIILGVAIFTLIVLLIVVLFYQKTKSLNKQLLLQQQELKSLNNFKDKLFSIISHDLRSPVATIVNLLGILEEEEDNAEMKTFIPRLKQHSRSTLDVMDKLLIWGQTQLKGATQNKTHFNVKDIILQSLDLHQETADQKGIKLIDNTPDEVLIFADSSHVEFVIRNLIANAVKYTRAEGFVEVNADINSQKGYTTLVIKDNGIGVAKSLQDKIFEPDNESMEGTDSEKGNSIGLMLCKEFVERNDGKIWVESELGKGTSFYVSFKQ